MNPMILLTALSVGQYPGGPPVPAAVYPLPARPTVTAPYAVRIPVAGQPQPTPTQPGTQPGIPPMTGTQPGMPPGMTPGTSPPQPGASESPEEEKTDKGNEEPAPPEPYAVMRILQTTRFGQRLADAGVNITGWTEGNYTASTASRSNFPIAFNDRADFWQMNQNFLRVNRAIDTSKQEFQLGFMTEWILPGTDARFTPSRGLLDDQTGDYRIDLIQVYTETFFPGLGPKGTAVKFGKFATHCSYELMQGAETPFLSRSYMFQYNPFTHTGVWATTPLNDTWTVSNGLVLGSDNFFGAPAQPTYLGQLKWAPKESKTNVLLNAVVTDPRYNQSEAFPFYNYYGMVLTHNFSDKFTYVLDTAFAHIDGAPVNGGFASATWYGAANYFIYKHNCKFTSTLRAEVFEDTKGFRTGTKGLYTEVTYGLAWSPTRALIVRPSVRYDYNAQRPFEGKANLFTACMDVIVRW